MSRIKKIDKAKIFESYDRIAKQEIAELRKLSASKSLERGIKLISDMAKWKRH